MVARYLMDEEEAVELDYEKMGNICRIKSILRHWLNNYDLFPDQIQMDAQIKTIFVKNYKDLVEQ